MKRKTKITGMTGVCLGLLGVVLLGGAMLLLYYTPLRVSDVCVVIGRYEEPIALGYECPVIKVEQVVSSTRRQPVVGEHLHVHVHYVAGVSDVPDCGDRIKATLVWVRSITDPHWEMMEWEML